MKWNLINSYTKVLEWIIIAMFYPIHLFITIVNWYPQFSICHLWNIWDLKYMENIYKHVNDSISRTYLQRELRFGVSNE